MRQGPTYGQWGLVWLNHQPFIGVPLELADEISDFRDIEWTDNRDGTYTLRPCSPKGVCS